MKSAVRRVLLLSALLSPGALYALGLGEIHLHSALNQPFDADIDLIAAQDDDLSALRASLAANDIFARYGIDKPAYLSDFAFRVVRGSDGRSYLKVTSPRPVTEPFVTMLVEADWPRGRLLREYTVLLDPPVFAPTQSAGEPAVAAPVVQTSPKAPSRAPEPRPEAAPAYRAPPPAAAPERQATTRPTVTLGSEYRVQRNDTLWKIASETHPGSRSDVNRAMVAIYQTNQHAFNGNINVLRAGTTLRIPEAAAIEAISASAAAAEVSRQYHLWRDETAGAESSDASGGRLRLVTPEQGTAAASTATTPEAPAAGASSTQLQSRVQQLEAELAEARRLLEVKNAELATLQGQAAAGQPGAEAPGTTPGATTTPGAEAPAAGTPPSTAAAPPAAVEPVPAPAAAPEAKKPAQQPKAAKGPSLTERLAGYWWVLLGLIAAALAIVLYRRSRGESGDKEVDLQEALARTRTDLRARGPVTREPAIVVEERRPTESTPAPAAAPKPSAPTPARAPQTVEDTISGEEPVSVESGDPLAEADFHMAYGLYDQAAELVQVAIKRAPQRRDLKLKLLEIFFVWGNSERFVELAREMNSTRDDARPGEWDKIVIMGKQIAPDDAMFADASPMASSLDMELHGSDGPLDMDLGAVQGSTQDVDFKSDAPSGDDDGGLDFDVTESVSGGEATSMSPTIEVTRIAERAHGSEDPTQEVAIEDLGIDVGDAESLDDDGDYTDMLAATPRAVVEDTVERPRISTHAAPEEQDEDLLSATGIMKEQTGIMPALDSLESLDTTGEISTVEIREATVTLSDQTSAMPVLDATGEVPTFEAGEATGQLPTIETTRIQDTSSGAVDFDLGEEPVTLSEVGTKLDLARAYVDMGDPEGARSILDEVLKEGSAEQKQEAERLMASLPS
jgi:pilus assembly protein FimV